MAKTESRNIGIGAEAPRQACDSENCPFHGTLSVRGSKFTGTVISTKMRKTVTVEFSRTQLLSKYERYEKKRTRLKVHNPDCIGAKDGDIVKVMECRPLSKTKNFVIIQKLGQEKLFREKMEAREAAKFENPKKEEEKTEQKGEN